MNEQDKKLVREEIYKALHDFKILVEPPEKHQVRVFADWGYRDLERTAEELSNQANEFINSSEVLEVIKYETNVAVATHAPNQMSLDVGDSNMYIITITVTYI